MYFCFQNWFNILPDVFEISWISWIETEQLFIHYLFYVQFMFWKFNVLIQEKEITMIGLKYFNIIDVTTSWKKVGFWFCMKCTMLFSCGTEFHIMWCVLSFYCSLHPFLCPLTQEKNKMSLKYGLFVGVLGIWIFFVSLFSVSLFFFWSPAVHVGVEACGFYGKFCC